MSLERINEEQMIDIIWGATLMGGGGGGSIASGLQLMDACRDASGHVPDAVMVPPKAMGDAYASATAGMGAPAAIIGTDFSKYAMNAAGLLAEMAKREGKDLKFTFPVELGGFSIFFPFLLSIRSNGKIPIVDADGSGRAVPALETLLLNVNNCPTTPMALANDKGASGDRISVVLDDPYDAPLAEKIGRDISGLFGNMVGISSWLVNGSQLENEVCPYTITLCQQIGRHFRSAKGPKETLFLELPTLPDRILPMAAKQICVGRITEIKSDTHGGFDFGALTVEDVRDPSIHYRITFQNENLLLEKLVGESVQPMMTVPDITTMYCLDPAGAEGIEVNMPLSNADAKEGMVISVGVIKVDQKWFKYKDSMKWWNVWSECMDTIGYTGGYLPFEGVPG